jgi:hypothetical protein
MAKNTIRTYSTTAASNTDVGGVDIQGTAPASNMDDSVREIMSHLAETNAGTAPLDDTFSLCDPADATKKFRFDGGNITAGQTRVFTVPDADMVLGNIPNANDGAALGSATKSWSDLFLASGGVFNFNNGNYTVTHSSGILTFSGVIAAASTIEVGHATDTTISRGAAGFIAVEGNRVPSPASQAAGDILYRDTNEWARLPKGTALQELRMNSGATAPEWATPIFSKSFESTQQTITAGGSLTLAHSLGTKPKHYLIVLQCTTAELGFSIGDETLVNPSNTDIDDARGATIVPDSTNMNIRFGSNANTFSILRYDTGSNANITNASWRLVVRAWA